MVCDGQVITVTDWNADTQTTAQGENCVAYVYPQESSEYAGWTTPRYAVDYIQVTNNDLRLRNGPGDQYSILGKVTNSHYYVLLETSGPWGKIRTVNLTEGWVYLEGNTTTWRTPETHVLNTSSGPMSSGVISIEAGLTGVGSDRARVDYIRFKANAPGLRCGADFTVFVRIFSGEQVVWEKIEPNPTSLAFGAGLTTAEKETYIFNDEQPAVVVEIGNAHIAVDYIAHYYSFVDECRADPEWDVADVGSLPTMEIR